MICVIDATSFLKVVSPVLLQKKSISVAIKIMNALDTDVAVFGQYWKHAQFTVEGRPYEGDNK